MRIEQHGNTLHITGKGTYEFSQQLRMLGCRYDATKGVYTVRIPANVEKERELRTSLQELALMSANREQRKRNK